MRGSWEFIRAVGRHWITLMSGGIVTVAVGLFERAAGHPVPVFVYVIIISGFVIAGCFLAWRDERAKVLHLVQDEDGLLEMRKEAAQQEWDRLTDIQKEITRHLLVMGRLSIPDMVSFGIVSERRGRPIEKQDWDQVKYACFVEEEDPTDDWPILSIRPEFVKPLALVVRDNS